MEQNTSINLDSDRSLNCPSCGAAGVTEMWSDDEFEYGNGKDAVKLTVRVPMCVCKSCELTFTDWRAEELRHDTVCTYLNILKPAEIVAIRERNSLTQQEMADISRIGRASLARWETGAVFQNSSSDSLLRLLCFGDNIERLRQHKRVSLPPKSKMESRQRFRALSEPSISIHRRDSASFNLYLDA